MNILLRSSFVILAIPVIALGICLLSQIHWLENYWLWPQAPWHSYFFMASLFFANGIALLFCSYNKEIRAIVPVAMGSLISFLGSGIYILLQAHATNQIYDQTRLQYWGNTAIFYSICYAIILLVCWRMQFKHATKLPLSLRFMLGFVVAVNLWVGLRLIGVEDAFPWKLAPEMMVVYGWGLLGTAVFVAVVLLEPYWENVGPLFAAFIVYDLILFYPIFYVLFHPQNIQVTFYRAATFLILITLTLLMVIGYSFYKLKILKSDHQIHNP